MMIVMTIYGCVNGTDYGYDDGDGDDVGDEVDHYALQSILLYFLCKRSMSI